MVISTRLAARLRLLTFAFGALLLVSPGLAWLKRPPPESPRTALQAHPCRIPGYAYAIECGELAVPLSYARGAANERRSLRWYRVPAQARYPLADPLLWIADGPGVHMTDRAAGMIAALRRVRNNRDLIWLEPRGMPSGPVCVPSGEASLAQRMEPLAQSRIAADCRAAWAAWGGVENLSASTRAADLAMLRRGLGLPAVNLLAEGAGVKVALAWMQLEPQALRSQVWDSPPPLSGHALHIRAERSARALQAAIAACLEDARCRAAYPDPAVDLTRARWLLPADLVLTHPQSGTTESLHFTDAMLASLLDKLLRSPARAAALPAALHAAASGNWQPLFGLAALGWPRQDSIFGWELWLAEACLDGSRLAPPPAGDMPRWFFGAQADSLAMACGSMVPYTVSARQEIALPVPTLVLASETDPLGDLPPAGVLAVNVPGAGHGVLAHDCAQDVLYRFVHAGGRLAPEALQSACLQQVPYPAPLVLPRQGARP